MNWSNIVQTLFIGLFVLIVAPVTAAPTSPGDALACTPASTAVSASAAESLQSVLESGNRIAAASTCTASCWDGSTVTCDQGSSCTAMDSNCNAEIRGYCEDSSGQTLCPACLCTASTACSGGRPQDAIDCSGNTYCNEAPGCWVHCDGVTTWCPDADPFTCPAVN